MFVSVLLVFLCFCCLFDFFFTFFLCFVVLCHGSECFIVVGFRLLVSGFVGLAEFY